MAEIQVEPRDVTGKQVRALRRQGITPAHLYGKDAESLTLQAATPSIITLLRTAGANAIINLKVEGESETRSVVLRGVQRHPATDQLLHIDFFQISLTEKLRADVPLVLKGEAPAVHVFGGLLLQGLDHISIHALPTEIPSHIDVDVTGLDVLDSAVHVRDIALPEGAELLTDPDMVVAKVEAPRLAVEEEAAPAAAEGEEAAEGAEGEAAPGAAAEEKKEGESE